MQGGHLGYTEIQAVVFMYAMSAHQAGYMANILSNISDTASCGQSIISNSVAPMLLLLQLSHVTNVLRGNAVKFAMYSYPNNALI